MTIDIRAFFWLSCWRLNVRWYYFALRVERAMGRRFGWAALRIWHRYAVWYPLVFSFCLRKGFSK